MTVWNVSPNPSGYALVAHGQKFINLLQETET